MGTWVSGKARDGHGQVGSGMLCVWMHGEKCITSCCMTVECIRLFFVCIVHGLLYVYVIHMVHSTARVTNIAHCMSLTSLTSCMSVPWVICCKFGECKMLYPDYIVHG